MVPTGFQFTIPKSLIGTPLKVHVLIFFSEEMAELRFQQFLCSWWLFHQPPLKNMPTVTLDHVKPPGVFVVKPKKKT